MSKDPRLVDLKYKDGSETIFDIVKGGKLPVVGRVVDVRDTRENYTVFFSKLPENTDIMLYTKLKVKFAVVKVLNYHDNQAKETEMGSKFVREHGAYVGKEFLLPAKYGGGIKFVHRPGSVRCYSTVAQVIEEMPKYVKVLENLNVVQDDYTNRKIKEGTVLEIKNAILDPLTKTRNLEVSDGHRIHLLHQDERVSLTAVDDPKQYHLFELLRSKILPKVFMFQNDALKDVILLDYRLNSAAMASVDGPLELKGFVDIDVVVGWIRSKAEKSYQTILIPIGLWQTAKIQERCFYSDEEKVQFIDKKYGPCKNVDFVEKSLYLTTNDDTNITWLRSPDFYKRTYNEPQMFDVVKTDFEDSSDDDEDSLYSEISEESLENPEHVKESKNVFKKVQEEFRGLMHRYKPHLSRLEPPPGSSKSGSVQRSVSDLTHACGQFYRQPYMSPPDTKDHARGGRSEQKTHEEHKAKSNKPPPLLFWSKSTESSVPTSIANKKNPKKYLKETSKDASITFKGNQMAETFFKYSVTDVSYCFRDCGLADFADKCFESKLDGAFFKNFDLSVLKEGPFYLTSFQVEKVKKIIDSGWRPDQGITVFTASPNRTERKSPRYEKI